MHGVGAVLVQIVFLGEQVEGRGKSGGRYGRVHCFVRLSCLCLFVRLARVVNFSVRFGLWVEQIAEFFRTFLGGRGTLVVC